MRAAVLLVLVVGCGGNDAAVDAGIPNDAGADMRHVLAQTVNDMTVDLAVANMAMLPDMTQPPDLAYINTCPQNSGCTCAARQACTDSSTCCSRSLTATGNWAACDNGTCCYWSAAPCYYDSDCCSGGAGACVGVTTNAAGYVYNGNCCISAGQDCKGTYGWIGCCPGLNCTPDPGAPTYSCK